MGKIASFLTKTKGQKVYFDDNIFIYVLNNTPHFVDVCLPFFDAVESGDIEGCTGDIGFSELLVKPMQTNDMIGIDQIHSLFDERGYFELISHSREMFEMAAYIRANQKLKMPDAIHTATAIKSGCKYMVTYDDKLARRANGIEVINIREFLSDDILAGLSL